MYLKTKRFFNKIMVVLEGGKLFSPDTRIEHLYTPLPVISFDNYNINHGSIRGWELGVHFAIWRWKFSVSLDVII